MSILEMAKAHMGSVQKAIVDLQNQKQNIEQEIQKLTEYLSQGLKEINQETSHVEVVEEESVSK